MGCVRWLGLLLLTLVPATSFAGDIQVACPPGLRVYLDGRLAGTSSSREDGLFLANVREGAHVVRVEKDGFAPQSYHVEVRELPIEVKVEEFSPEPPSRQEGKADAATVRQPVGDLLVTSAPQNCVVEIDGKTQTKSTPVLRVEGLEPGEHPISFAKPGYDRLSGVVRIQPASEVTVRGDLQAGRLEILYDGEGSLRVVSVPEYCTIRFLGKTREKTSTLLNVSHVPAGEHRIVVLWKGRELSSNVTIARGERTVVTVSFLERDKPFVVSHEPE